MTGASAAFALAAMIPAMLDGALMPVGGSDAMILSLCSGGSITVSSGEPATPRPANAPCCAKGCRDSERRRKGSAGPFDPAQ